MTIAEIVTTTKALLDGFGVVAALFVIVMLLSIPLGFFFTVAARSRFAPLRVLMKGYIYVIRSTPLMLQMFFVYFGAPYLPLVGEFFRTWTAFSAACFSFVFNYAAYFAEIFRGGLLAVDKGQYEASQVLGLSKVQTTVHIVLPQMFRVVLPSITNESITLVKDTALMFSIAVPEILHYAKVAVARTTNPMPFFIAFVIYLIINSVLQLVFNWLEKKMAY